MKAVFGAVTIAATVVLGTIWLSGPTVPDSPAFSDETALAVPKPRPPARMILSAAAATAPQGGPVPAPESSPGSAPVQLAAANAATAADVPVTETPDGREPILCLFWAVQKLAEQAGIIDTATTESVSDRAYPVPTPVWVVNALIKASDTQEI